MNPLRRSSSKELIFFRGFSFFFVSKGLQAKEHRIQKIEPDLLSAW